MKIYLWALKSSILTWILKGPANNKLNTGVIKETLEIDTTPVKKGASADIISTKANFINKFGAQEGEDYLLRTPASSLSRNSIASEDQSSNNIY